MVCNTAMTQYPAMSHVRKRDLSITGKNADRKVDARLERQSLPINCIIRTASRGCLVSSSQPYAIVLAQKMIESTRRSQHHSIFDMNVESKPTGLTHNKAWSASEPSQ